MVIAWRAVLDDHECGHNHRSERAATVCGTKLARSLEAPPQNVRIVMGGTDWEQLGLPLDEPLRLIQGGRA